MIFLFCRLPNESKYRVVCTADEVIFLADFSLLKGTLTSADTPLSLLYVSQNITLITLDYTC